MNYQIYVTTENGQGYTEELRPWNGEDIREFHLNAFDRYSVISIVPDKNAKLGMSSNETY